MTLRFPDRPARRDFLRLAVSLATGLYAQGSGVGALAQALRMDTSAPLLRRALVLGNTTYVPERQAIPSSRKNAADVATALTELGFQVRREVDQGTGAMRALVQEFFGGLKSAPERALAVFYYTGHGIQHRGENYMVASDVPLSQRSDAIARASINIDQDIIGQASLPNDGTCVLIFDACRNDPAKVKTTDAASSFNQVNPPRGTVITFSTAPGRYAIAPLSADENSIYTGILVRELRKANADITVKDFLDHVKFEVRRYMQNHEEPFLRKHAQDPEVAANLALRMSFALEKAPPPVAALEETAWSAIEQTIAPAERVKLLQDFIKAHPESRFRQAAEVQLERAQLSDAATRRNRVQIEQEVGDAEYRSDQAKALDGDKDAAFRVAQMFERGSNAVPKDERKMVQWLRHASELRNGIASYQLYLYYRDRQMDRDAVRFENLARDQGYTPPPRLDTRRG